ncbi:hypothetical protein [Pararhizobium sp. O133]|uniref:hypothetical protein n=1 Tax=Pararhizobium sp. O133 TaxID=3449278 RepID=UPI003F68500A
MQPTIEKKTDSQVPRKSEVLSRLETVAKESRGVYDGAIADFRNSFTLGPTKFDCEESDR